MADKQFSMTSIVSEVNKQFKGTALAKRIGVGNRLRQLAETDFIKMPPWWVNATRTPGLPFGTGVLLAGKTDSGKTSGALDAIKATIEQGGGVIYGETENKTTERDLVVKSIDPDKVAIVRTTVVEQMFEAIFALWDEFRREFPERPLLIVIDSLGNTISLRDSELSLTDGKQKPGGKGAGNRLALMKLLSRMEESTKVALFLVSYTYANIGSPGRTNAGGDAVNLLCSLIYQTTRRGWLEKTVKGEKERIGAAVQWTLYKNHVFKDKPGPKQVLLNITSAGIEYQGEATFVSSENDVE